MDTVKYYQTSLSVSAFFTILILIVISNFLLESPRTRIRLLATTVGPNYENGTTAKRFNITSKSDQPLYEKRKNIRREFKDALMFPNQDVSQTLADIKKLLEPYIRDIKLAAVELRKEHKDKPWTDHGPTLKYINAYDEGYFEAVATLPSVRTIIANTDFHVLRKVMHTSHYHYGSSNCTKLEEEGNYGKFWGKVAFNSSCQEDLLKQKDEMEVSLNHMAIGLPQAFTLLYPQVAVTFMHIVSNAIVIGQGDVFVDQAKIIVQRCSQFKSNKGRPQVDVLPHYDEVFTICHYRVKFAVFHFIVESQSRISAYLDFLLENKHIKIHVSTNHSVITNWLPALGISEDRLVSGSIKASLLYVPAGSACGRPSYVPTNLLSMKLRQSLGLTKGPRDTVVVIKRTKLRFFKYHDEIFNMVREVAVPLGFRVLLFADDPVPSFEETKEMFQRAVLILGPHGAGFSNMLFSQPGTMVMEGLCHKMNLCFRNLAAMLGHRYFALIFNKSCIQYRAAEIKPFLEYFLQHVHAEKL